MRSVSLALVLLVLSGCTELLQPAASPTPTPPPLTCENGQPWAHGTVKTPKGTLVTGAYVSSMYYGQADQMVDTDAWGRYHFCGPGWSRYEFEFNKTGFQDLVLQGSAGRPLTLDAVLQPLDTP